MAKVAATRQPLFIVADVEGEALALLVLNHVRGALKVCAVKPPGFGDNRAEYLADIAALVGTTLVDASLGKRLKDLELSDLGRAELITVDLTSTVIVGGKGDQEHVRRRISVIQGELDRATSEPMRIVFRSRIAQLAGGVATIKIGAFTELEMQEKRARIDDALHATRAAAEEGIVPGGGVALIRALTAIDASSLPVPERYGAEVVWKALQQPLFQIASNGGLEGAVIVSRVRELEGAVGYNVRTQRFEDLIAAGIIDPTKVVRLGLLNAASVASMLLTVAVGVAENTPRRSSSGMGADFA
jgi:chaperonin GroEL